MIAILAQSATDAEGSNLGLSLALVGFLVILNAAFAGSEIALVSLREGQISRLGERGRAGRALAQLAHDPNRFLSTIQIGITLAGFLASATATVTLAGQLAGPLSFFGDAAPAVAILLVTAILTFIQLVLGELAPKRLALQRAESWSLLAARPLAFLARISAPAVWVLTYSTNAVVRLLGGDPTRNREEVTEEELRDLVAAQQSFSIDQRRIISGAFEIDERSLREVLVPRLQVLAVDENDETMEVVSRFVATGHSRAPVYRGNLDDVMGVVHLRDVVGQQGPVGQYARPAMVLPETVGVLDALRRLQHEREQLAIVVNEHGATEGIVTVEDLLEEIVGEIYDEFDPEFNPADARGVQREEDGSLTMPGSFPMHDLPDIQVILPEGDYATIAGLILERLGHIPEPGESLELGGWHIEVLVRDGNAIGRIRLRPLTDAERSAQ